MADRQPDKARAVANDLCELVGTGIDAERGVAERESVEAMVVGSVADFGLIDVLANNTGIPLRPAGTFGRPRG